MPNDQEIDTAYLVLQNLALMAEVRTLKAEVARQKKEIKILDMLACRLDDLPDTSWGKFSREVAEALDRHESVKPVPPSAPSH